jgi:type IV pilus assembly protein PilC
VPSLTIGQSGPTLSHIVRADREGIEQMFSKRLSSREMADWCRSLATSLRAGVPLLKALQTLSNRSAGKAQRASEALLQHVRHGESMAQALEAESAFFPPLLVPLANVGVQTGHLPEILRELEKYYRFQETLRQRLVQQITWPVFQLVMAILVIALVIYLIGMLGGADILGLGLLGARGAMIWIAGWALLAAGLFGGYQLARTKLGQAQRIDALLLRIPVLGNVLRSLALARMTLGLDLTLESGMSLKQAIPLSLAASDNGLFADQSKPILADIRGGSTLTEAFRERQIFPAEFLDVLENAEESGKVPEAMRQLSVELAERAEHQLGLLHQALGWVVWMIVAGIIIFFILRIAMNAYIGPINEALDALPG